MLVWATILVVACVVALIATWGWEQECEKPAPRWMLEQDRINRMLARDERCTPCPPPPGSFTREDYRRLTKAFDAEIRR